MTCHLATRSEAKNIGSRFGMTALYRGMTDDGRIVISRIAGGLALAASLIAGCATTDEPEDPALETTTAVSALDGICGSEPKQLPVGNSIRVLSFNTELLSPWFSNPSPDAGLPADAITNEKAAAIAAILRAGKFDVIGLNEVWDEDDGKDQLVAKLCPTYPNFVRSVDASTVTEERPEDSGLMLFSKLAFLPLPNLSFVSDDSESSLGNNSNRIAYTRFDSCAGTDCLASKGALMVRLLHPSSGRVLDFVNTHMQADEAESGIRTAQMRQIRGQCQTGALSPPNLITTTLGLSLSPLAGLCSWTNTEWLTLTGDHNIPGEGAVKAAVHPGTAFPALGPPEWNASIGVFSDAVATNKWALYDAWAETTSPLDRGITNEQDGARLDYMLTSRRTTPPPVVAAPPPDLCVQHVWSPPELEGLSDHRPVASDLNLMAAQCNPRLAYQVLSTDLAVPGQSKSGRKLKRAIVNPGNMQWFRVTEPGTYTFALSDAAAGNGLAMEVFADENLSVPIGGAQNLGSDVIKTCEPGVTGAQSCSRVTGTKLVIPQAPFFVRVFSTSRAFTGAYAFTAYKYKCNAPTEACAVLPNAPQPFNFPAPGTALGTEDAAWFEVNIRDQADSGAAQTLRFHADNTAAAAWTAPKVSVFDSTGTSALASIDGIAMSGTLFTTNPAGKSRVSRMSGAKVNQRVLIKVGRTNVNNSLTIKAGWQTDLVLVGAISQSGATLVCDDETNPEVGVDEIRMRIKVDGTWRDGGFAEFDCNNNQHHRVWNNKIGVVRALSTVGIRVLEEDDFLAGADDDGGTGAVNMLPLESELTQAQHHNLHWSFSDGDYHFAFSVGKWVE
jgi:endonuclease/exonuclease/phosphatase family metal-dependent hydrolase